MLLVAVAAVYLLHVSRHASFFYDEWSWISARRGWAPHNFLQSHNGHFSATPVLIYHLLFGLFGLHSYLPYRLTLMAVHVGTCLAVYRYAETRVGPWLAVVATGAMCVVGPAYQNLIWAFQIGFIGALMFGLCALIALDRVPTSRGNVVATILLLLAISSSGTGLCMLAAAVVRLAVRRQWSRWPVVAVPGAVYLIWYARYGGVAQDRTGIRDRLTYFVREFRSAVGGLTGHQAKDAKSLAATLAVVVVIILVIRLGVLLRARDADGLADLAAVVVAATVLWGLTAVARGAHDDYGASRYLYSGGLLVVLLLVEGLRWLSIRRVTACVLAVVTAIGMAQGLPVLNHGTKSLTAVDTYVRADLAAVDLLSAPNARYAVNPRFVPTLTVGQYLSIRRDLGSPAFTLADLPRQSPGVRNDVDRVLSQAGGLKLIPTLHPAQVPHLIQVGPPSRNLPASRGCSLLPTDGARQTIEVPLPTTGVEITASRADILVLVRRFGPTAAHFGTVPAGASARLLPAPDPAGTPWRVNLRSSGPIELCLDR